MLKILKEKTLEAIYSVTPICLIVFIIYLFLPIDFSVINHFLIGSLFLIIGMGLFSVGADSSIMVIGELVGKDIIKRKKLSLIIGLSLVIGFMVTIAEPDLTILAEQFPIDNKYILIIPVSIGTGIFLVLACLRLIFQIRLSHLLVIGYAIIFLLATLINPNFLPIALDSGGVTTGPITVPFILAFGLGLSSNLSEKDHDDDSFGLVALCSIGPVIAVMILAFFISGSEMISFVKPELGFWEFLAIYAIDVLIALLPIIIFFTIYNFLIIKVSKKEFIKIFIGIFITYLGVVFFLTGTNYGYMPVGRLIGEHLASTPWLLILIGAIMGFFTVMAEPAVHVLNKQVSVITSGTITKKMMLFSLGVGIALAVGLSMMRIVWDISIWWIVLPGYLIAITFSFIVPKIFTAIAFDSGGVASGSMAAAFILPFALGACSIINPDKILLDAFGVIASVAMMPLVVIQIIGLIYKIKLIQVEKAAFANLDQIDLDEVINFYKKPEDNKTTPITPKRSIISRILNKK